MNPRNKLFLDCFSEEIPEADIYCFTYIAAENNVIICSVEAANEKENTLETIFTSEVSLENFIKCLPFLGIGTLCFNSEKNIITTEDGKKSYKYIQIFLPLAVATFSDGVDVSELNFGEFLTKKIRSQFKLEMN